MRIKKVINNNVLCVVDQAGRESIVTGKGIGFQRKTGQFVDPSSIEKTYHMEDQGEQRKLRELCQQIPLDHLKLTEELISHIKSQIRSPLNESLLITLADHISFAIQRKQKGIEFENPLQGAVVCYYPTEYRLGWQCLEMIREKTGVQLSDSEASFITLHIVNAELNTSMSVMYDITRLIDGAVQVVEYYYKKQFDRESLDFSRFVVHLRYFAQRLLSNQMLADGQEEQDASFYQLIAKTCQKHYQCAKCIADYIQNTYQKELSEGELIYLTIHLKRINMDASGK